MVGGKFSKNFVVEVGVRQRCMMSPWLFNTFVDGCVREMKCKMVNMCAKLRFNGEVWWSLSNGVGRDCVVSAWW